MLGEQDQSSKQAVRAAIWAIDEAVHRGAPLRLVYVMPAGSGFGDPDRDYRHVRHALHKAWAAVESTGAPVELESDIRQGHVVTELIEASRSATMSCVGSRGVDKHKPVPAWIAKAAGTLVPGGEDVSP